MNIQNMLNSLDLPAVAEIASLEALRAVADSQRHRILCMLIEEPLTPTAIAEKLSIARTRVYYHLEILKKHGFIAIVGERAVAAVIERTYRALARTFKVDRSMIAASSADVYDAQAKFLERAADDLREVRDAEVLVMRKFLRLTPAGAERFRAALQALRTEFADSPQADGEWYEFAVALFPTEGQPT